MPFPVTKLAYGHLVRLGELSFPAERYQLQVSAGNFNICPPTYTKVIRYTDAYFRPCPKKGKVMAKGKIEHEEHKSDTAIDLDGDTVAECCRFIELFKFDCEMLDSDAMKHVILSPKWSIFLPLSSISTEFLTKLSYTIFSPVKYIDMKNSDFQSTIADLLKLFPHIDSIDAQSIYKPLHWLDDLVNTPGCKVKELHLSGEFEALTTFAVPDLVKYYETRNRKLDLKLEFTNLSTRFGADPAAIPKRLKNFDKLFEELKLKLRVDYTHHSIVCHGLKQDTFDICSDSDSSSGSEIFSASDIELNILEIGDSTSDDGDGA